MIVAHVEVLVEEPSMEEALRHLLPKLLGEVSFGIYPHQGKADLLAKLPDRLRGYARWMPLDYRVLVIVDRDGEDCAVLKGKLEQIAAVAGLVTRSGAGGASYAVVNRIAIEELEAWFFGDWEAVRTCYPQVPALESKRKFRDPDAIAGGTWEALEQVFQQAGYFTDGLRKIEAARTISAKMCPERNTSKSFQVLRDTLLEMAATRQCPPDQSNPTPESPAQKKHPKNPRTDDRKRHQEKR